MDQLCARRFTALVRWRCCAVPELEVETHQAGFASPEEAALAANGLGNVGFDELLVERSTVTVLRDGTAQDGRSLTIFGWVSVGSDFPGVPREWAFERTERIADRPAAITPGERFAPYAFRIVDELTGDDISVEFLITPRGVTLLVARAGTRTAQSTLLFT